MQDFFIIVTPVEHRRHQRYGRLVPITTAALLSAAAWIGIFWSAALIF